ncbi:MAG: sugar phosphate isomerase/epimerase [Planctomycetales bacterium]|nr:sugar phosphate isomerase/epimerase [Planctomycetales bacterium]
MPELKIGIGLSSLRQPFKKALHTAAQLGAQGVEIDARNDLRPTELSDTGRRQLRKLLEDLNLRVVAVRFPTRRGYDVLQDLDRRIEATKEAMRFAYSLGASVVVNAVGYVPEDSQHPAYDQLQVSLSDLARYGQHMGAMLGCETGSEPPQRLVGLLASLPDQAIGIAFNPGNLVVNDCYSEQAIGECASRTLLVTARDAVRDLSRGRGIDVPLGRGSVDFPHILGTLEEAHYRGWFIVDRLSSENPIAELGHAISYLKAL